MRRTALICCVLVLNVALLTGANSESPPTSPPQWFWGCWVVKKLLPTSGVSGLSKEQVNALIGRRLVFGKSCARSGNAVAQSPVYSTSVLSDRDFFSLGYASLAQIGVKDNKVVRVQLTKPEFSDLDFAGNDVFLRENDVVIEVENDYFVAERAKSEDAACTCEKASAPHESAQSHACNEKAKTQTEINACASDEAARADAELNEVYRKVLAEAGKQEEAVAKIKAAERAWIAYRDAYMDAMYPAKNKQAEYGSIYPMEADLLRAKLTQRQVTALKELLQQYSGDEHSATSETVDPKTGNQSLTTPVVAPTKPKR
jgi:uncharacterized protein YecT (DUF1311 family)